MRLPDRVVGLQTGRNLQFLITFVTHLGVRFAGDAAPVCQHHSETKMPASHGKSEEKLASTAAGSQFGPRVELQAAMAVFAADLQGKLTGCSADLLELAGKTASQLIGHDIFDLPR
jgi:hypothetical protein